MKRASYTSVVGADEGVIIAGRAHCGLDVEKMGANRCLRSIRIAPTDGVDPLEPEGHSGARAARTQGEPESVARAARTQALQFFGGDTLFRNPQVGIKDCVGELSETAAVIGLGRRLELLGEFAKLNDIALADPLGRTGDAQAFDHHADFGNLQGFLDTIDPNLRAPVSNPVDKLLPFEIGERISNREAARAEGFTKLAFDETLARDKIAPEDPPAKSLG